jgi:EAL domain-containing protein (putative c-di-GMP-specific phosphodiesterase class I)/CheY-like chemotaxis protein
MSMEACRLLILDDDETIGMTIEAIAISAGAVARLTSEPDEFFGAVADWQPTHICTDLNMPGMDGLAVLTELARRDCKAQVIISSGVGMRVLDAAARKGAEQGLSMCGVLAKPFMPDALRQLLQRQAPVLRRPMPRPDPAYLPDRAALAMALDQRELFVLFQPKVHCASGHLAGLEALVRWQHPVHGLIAPDRFIELAEVTCLIDELTLQVLDQSLAWFVPWRETSRDRQTVTLSINLSARSFGNPTLVSQLHARCQAAGMPPDRLIFELTETAAMDDPVLALELLTRLRMQGFQLAIDDFGTGYSSMVQLVRQPFSEVKVDLTFVKTAATSEESRIVIRTIVGLGHSLGMRVTAEGVEDSIALAYLRDIGCDEAQGYLIGKPMAPAALDTWLAAYKPAG